MCGNQATYGGSERKCCKQVTSSGARDAFDRVRAVRQGLFDRNLCPGMVDFKERQSAGLSRREKQKPCSEGRAFLLFIVRAAKNQRQGESEGERVRKSRDRFQLVYAVQGRGLREKAGERIFSRSAHRAFPGTRVPL